MILALSRSPIRALIENGLILKSELCDHSAEIRHGVVNVAHHIDKSLVKKPESRKVLDMSDICNLPKELVILSPDKGHEEALFRLLLDSDHDLMAFLPLPDKCRNE